MTSKKYTLLAIVFLLFSVASIAQDTDWGWDWKDSSKIPAKRMPQHNEFLNNNYPYPAKPRSQWELGFSAGPSLIIGDVKPKIGIGGSITARKAINHTFSLRAGYYGSLNSGKPNTWGNLSGQPQYRNQKHGLGFDLIASLNPISYYRGNPKMNWYLTAGYEFIATRVQYKDITNAWRTFYAYQYPNSQSGIIGTIGGDKHNGRHAWTMLHGVSVGAGVAYKINNKTNIKLEQRFTKVVTGYDLLDPIKGGKSDDMFSYTSVGVNLNMGKTSKRVQPLWWLNPNNFAYNELNKPAHMKMPKVKLDDADSDGVTDQFDLEPNTPAGAKVDARGRAVDTDGDGIPDYKDKEILTSQKCFPVNNDGVGTCPEPPCCKELRDEITKLKETGVGATNKATCEVGELPSIQFKGNSKLTKDAQAVLATVAQKIHANPNCKIKVTGYGSTSKSAQQSSWEKVNAVIKYLVEKQGVAESRLIFTYGQDGDANTVDLQGTTEDGPNSVPAPHPNLRK
jgi:OOP family OmpA-OmpF porin